MNDSATVSEREAGLFQQEGIVFLRGLFRDWVDVLRKGMDKNISDPGPHSIENTRPGEPGRFFEDYCNWERIPEFREFVMKSPAAQIAAVLMRSERSQFFHEHILLKDAGTHKPTPWHQDMPYYPVSGMQTVSFWVPLDPVPLKNGLRLVSGSHLWNHEVRPTKWLDNDDFYNQGGKFQDLSEIRDSDIRVWDVEPGDAIAFNFYTLHGTSAEPQEKRRRAFSHRWLGDDVRYRERGGRTSPPFPGLKQKNGEPLCRDRFPILWPRE